MITMESIRAGTDGSWKPIRDEMGSLWRAQQKNMNRYKMLRNHVRAGDIQRDAIMNYLDGSHRVGKGGAFLNFNKTDAVVLSEQEPEGD